MSTTPRLAPALVSELFTDDEPVIQSQSLLAGATVPAFGNADAWLFAGVIRLPANTRPGAHRLIYRGLDPVWNLRAREMAMICLNHRHPKVIARGVHLDHRPQKVTSIRRRLTVVRALSCWAQQNELPASLPEWPAETLIDYLADALTRMKDTSGTSHVTVIKALHQLGPLLTGGGLAADPWPNTPAYKVLKMTSVRPVTTQAVSPQTWFPLMKAAWTYIDTFAPDILRANRLWHEVKANARSLSAAEAREMAAAWLADPANKVPIHSAGPESSPDVNFYLLTWMIGINALKRKTTFLESIAASKRLLEAVLEVAKTRTQIGIIEDLVVVDRPDGSRGPWHLGLDPREIWMESLALRNACYVFTVGLSMMRDGEVREITKGSVVEHYGSPAVKSTKTKLDPDLPLKHWWIIEPVAKAIDTVSQLSFHEELAFGSVLSDFPNRTFDSGNAVMDFIRRVNERRHLTGLDEIPVEHVAPHMFRVTMAMLTRDQPGAEVAIGMQLKHVATRALANRVSQGYAAPQKKWLDYLDNAVEQARFRRLRDMFDEHEAGRPIGYGPAADRLRETFEAVRSRAAELRATGQARHGDRRVEHDLLANTRVSIRFGKLNHCTMDDANPAGAKCLEDTVIPAGHTGPLQDRCQPAHCGNSILGLEHVPIWTAERGSLLRLIDTPGLANSRKSSLDGQLSDVELMLRRIPT